MELLFRYAWTMRVMGEEKMSMPRAMVFRGWILNHQVHHRAQAGVYLRLNDIAVPQTYGPTADDTAM